MGIGKSVTCSRTSGYSFFTVATALLDGDVSFEGERCERGVPFREGVGNLRPELREECVLFGEKGGEVRW